MKKLFRKIISPPSLKLNVRIVSEVVLLLLASLAVMFYYSRKTLREEVTLDAEQVLEGTVQHVDNILLSVEQAAGNIYFELEAHLDQPDRMYTLSRRLVECNPNIMGCAIAFKPFFYPGQERFMAYVHRKRYDSPELITADRYSQKPYTELVRYRETMETGNVAWMNPQKYGKAEGEPVISFCLPIFASDGEHVGVLAVDVSLELLSHIIHTTKPSPHSYCILLDSDGTFIIHADREKLEGHSVFEQTEDGSYPRVRMAGENMLAGKTGSQYFRLNDEAYYVFYKPFLRNNVPGRALQNMRWSIGMVYPEEDISSAYRQLFLHVLTIAVIGLLVFYILCTHVIRRQLSPLRELTESAIDIAEGNYEVPISETSREDEIGRFQQHFNTMQLALAQRAREQEKLTATLQERHDSLRKAYEQTVGDVELKEDFLHNMTNQMIEPAEDIARSAKVLCDGYPTISHKDATREADNILRQCNTIMDMLTPMLTPTASSDTRKEAPHA